MAKPHWLEGAVKPQRAILRLGKPLKRIRTGPEPPQPPTPVTTEEAKKRLYSTPEPQPPKSPVKWR